MSEEMSHTTATDCTECRERLAADPSTDAVRKHVNDCADCRAWRDELRALDAQIAKALAVPVPPLSVPELPAVPVAGIERPRRRRLPATGWFALAASVLVAVALGLRLGSDSIPVPSLAEQVLTHIDHESYSLTVSDRAVGSDRLARIVPAGIAQFGPEAGLITYAQSCVINGHTVPHLVVQGEQGPVTILLMPEEKIDGPQHIANDELEGVILPVGDGSIAIVGTLGGDLGELEETIKNSVTWRT